MRLFFKYVLAGVLVLAGSAVFAQDNFTVKGVVMKKGDNQRLPLVMVTNLHTKAHILTGDWGDFTIVAHRGDTLLFTHGDYSEQRLPVTAPTDMIVYLQPTIQLKEVTVTGGKTRAEDMQDVMNEYKSKGLYYNGKPPVLAAIASPITGLHELFSKDASNARHFQAYMDRENEQTVINKKYNKALVKRVADLSDEDAESFMLIYQPSYEEVKKWNDYDAIAYIKRCLVDYKKNGDELKKSVKLN